MVVILIVTAGEDIGPLLAQVFELNSESAKIAAAAAKLKANNDRAEADIAAAQV